MAVTKGRTSTADATATLRVGDRAPEFVLTSHTGESWDSAQARGTNVVLAFYPFAFTATCGSQIPSYERELDRFRAHDTQVVGISTDPGPSIAAWAQSLGGISYPLLSDFHPHGAVAQQYGVFDAERGMAQRAIVIIDREGIVRYIDVHAIGEQPDEEQIFEQLAALRSGGG